MKKVLFYAMQGEKMCFLHTLLNALDLAEAGHEVKIIFEGMSVKLVSVLEEEANPLYKKAKEEGLIAGICKACSKVMEVYDKNQSYGLPMLEDLKGHAGMKKYIEEGFLVVSL
ncbi:MAG: hypothetical protein GX333_06460 [Syntrophomonadaceae bacterium]|nr:hypothetical protein [Syntrophomonadaceae bacterium]